MLLNTAYREECESSNNTQAQKRSVYLQVTTSLPGGQKQDRRAVIPLKAELLRAICQMMNSHNRILERQCIIQELAVALEAAQPTMSNSQACHLFP
jgi:hypothetical protein